MLIGENIVLALAGLRANKMRTFLTMLGIVIGIASVIAILTVGDATGKAAMSSMEDMGVNQISVYLTPKGFGENENEEPVREMKEKDYFTQEMFRELQKEFKTSIQGVSLNKSAGDVRAESGSRYAALSLNGVNDLFLKGKNLKLLAGRGFTQQDYESANKVILVSDKCVKNLLAAEPEAALGETLEIRKENRYYSYTIVGVYEYMDSASRFSGGGVQEKDLQTEAYLPLSAVLLQEKREDSYEFFNVLASPEEDFSELSSAIANFLNERYYKDNDGYQAYAYSMKAMIGEMETMLNTQKIAFAAIGGISLLVGGIGVMNIMIVSITERTREIGTRKALGATNGSIRLQFIVEAIVICLIGGIIGVILGVALGLAAAHAMNFPGRPSVGGILFCVLFSVAFGVFFGYYPASRAAKLNPIEALRYE